MSLETYKYRGSLILILLGVIFGGLIFRLYTIQIHNHTRYLALQESQFYHKEEMPPTAGMILDAQGRILAVSRLVFSAYAIPSTVKQNPLIISLLSQILQIPKEKIEEKICWAEENHKSFIWIKRYLSDQETHALQTKNLKGIGLRPEYKRFYPQGRLACHILGFRGIDEQALAGAELAYDKYLLGEGGYRLVPRDARQMKLLSLELINKPPTPGKNVYLTIDSVIQYLTEEGLLLAWKKYHPQSASAIVMECPTGKVLALANLPNFDPNQFNEYPAETVRNDALTSPYEPGSSFKPFVAATLLDIGAVHLTDQIPCEDGAFQWGNRIIHDIHPLGTLSFTEVIARSSNIGMAKLGLLLGKDQMLTALKRFDFDKPTQFGLPGESSGIITPADRWNDYTTTSVPMGHEIAVTSLQLIKAFNVFARNGYLIKPQLLLKVVDKEGNTFEGNFPQLIRQVISSETATVMREILRAVVQTGTGKLADIKGYQIAGKTGTAQKRNPDGTYAHDKHRSLFIGFAPAEAPRIIVLVMVNEPQGAYYGGTVAAPVVAGIIEKVLKYQGVSSSYQAAYENK